MARQGIKEPLYRKVNTRAHNVHHDFGGDYRDERHSKRSLRSEALLGSMHGKRRRGLDYTPLFKFLLSKVGQPWDAVHSEAVSRLDRAEPIFWMVAQNRQQGQDFVCLGESSYYSGLFVDEKGLLQVVNPSIGPESLSPFCSCCTHTFNGVAFSKKTPRALEDRLEEPKITK